MESGRLLRFQTWRMLVPVQALFLLPAHTITVMPRTMSGSVSHCPLESIRLSEPFDHKARHAVACTEKPRHKACSPRSGGGPPEQDEKQKPLSEGFVELRGVTRHAVARLREDHRPWKRCISGTPPELSVDEVADAPKHEAERRERCNEVRNRPERNSMQTAVENHDGNDAEKTAVSAHASLPDMQDLHGMRQVELRLIEKAVAEAAAQNDAEDAVEKQVLQILARNPAPRFGTSAPAEKPEAEEARQIHEAVPAYGKRS